MAIYVCMEYVCELRLQATTGKANLNRLQSTAGAAKATATQADIKHIRIDVTKWANRMRNQQNQRRKGWGKLEVIDDTAAERQNRVRINWFCTDWEGRQLKYNDNRAAERSSCAREVFGEF